MDGLSRVLRRFTKELLGIASANYFFYKSDAVLLPNQQRQTTKKGTIQVNN